MKKNLIALAVAGAMVVPMTAMADVKVFGAVKYEIGQYDNGVADANLMQRNVGSRLGFSGSEDLGNGLKGIFRIQGNFNGTGAGLNTGEETWVGLTGGFGTLRVGRSDDAMKKANAAGNFRIFGDTFLDAGGNNSVTDGISIRPGHWDRQDGIHYGNKFGTTSVAVTLAPTGTENETIMAASVLVPVGPVTIGAGYSSRPVSAGDRNTYLVNVDYKAGDIRVGVLYENMDTDGDSTRITVPFSYTMGANVIRAAYQKRDINNVDTNHMGVGFIHNFSKRTNAYANYGTSNQDTGGMDSPRVISVGVEHKF